MPCNTCRLLLLLPPSLLVRIAGAAAGPSPSSEEGNNAAGMFSGVVMMCEAVMGLGWHGREIRHLTSSEFGAAGLAFDSACEAFGNDAPSIRSTLLGTA